MIYSNEVVIDKPVEKVTALFVNPDNLQYWQEGFISHETNEGTPGRQGSRSTLKYKMGKREVEMTETIEVDDLPEEYTAIYETRGVWNRQVNQFQAIGENQTKYVSISEFKFSGFMMKLFGLLMPGAFKKQSQKYLDDFKKFVEGE